MMRILVAEDNIDNREILRRRLERRGYNVIEACDGKVAVEMTVREHPDMILMDISMPVMSGIEATVAIRKLDQFKRLPIIALTAHAMEGDREKCMNAGCSEFATKPVNFKNLVAQIETLHNAENSYATSGH